jgi:hypothetical protein
MHSERSRLDFGLSSWVIAHSAGTSADPMTPLVYVASAEGPIR